MLEKRKKIVEILKKVIDPEIGMDIVNLGLIYGIEITENGFVTIKMTLTTPGCPLTDFFLSEIEAVLSDLNFVEDVIIDFIWSPPWDLVMIDEKAKQELFKNMRS